MEIPGFPSLYKYLILHIKIENRCRLPQFAEDCSDAAQIFSVVPLCAWLPDTLDDSTQTWISALMQKNTIFNYKILILSSNGHFKRLRKYRQNFLWHTLPSNRKLRNLLGSDKEIELGLSCSADQSETEFVFLLSRWTNRRPYSWTGF